MLEVAFIAFVVGMLVGAFAIFLVAEWLSGPYYPDGDLSVLPPAPPPGGGEYRPVAKVVPIRKDAA
jgi:hypothetical protein